MLYVLRERSSGRIVRGLQSSGLRFLTGSKPVPIMCFGKPEHAVAWLTEHGIDASEFEAVEHDAAIAAHVRAQDEAR